MGPAFRATRTVTFFRRKAGHVLMPGRVLCGETIVADIAIPDDVLSRSVAPSAGAGAGDGDGGGESGAVSVTLWANAPGLWLGAFPFPQRDGHKYQRGHAVVVSGPPECTGAARLGARGALRIGAGLVTLVGSSAATAVNAAHLTAVMTRITGSDRALAEFLADRRRNAVLIGPGMGVSRETAQTVLTALSSEASVVIDADGLTSFAKDQTDGGREGVFGFTASLVRDEPSTGALFAAIGRRRTPVVITPHDGEFKRLFPDIAGSKLERARAAARLSGAVVVLKGPDTVIAAPDGRAAINENAPPWLATAGSGDVLAGFITGLLAQHMPSFEAAAAAVWLHGECAARFGPGLIAEDLPEQLPNALAQLLKSLSGLDE
jgi:NAD(P)H-hydrate epimerase